MNKPIPEAALVERFANDLDRLTPSGERVGIAVSGGPDSVALLLLAAAARPGLIEAATVDHRVREESSEEAALVRAICERIGIQHVVLPLDWPERPVSNLQARARTMRYDRLADWARERGVTAVATAHHADDQAETLLMRLARGSGLSGLAGIRARAELRPGVQFIRPLLRWRRSELMSIVEQAEMVVVDDPTNRDLRHDRTRFRQILGDAEWADPVRLSEAADHLREADEALEWALEELSRERVRSEQSTVEITPDGLPREIQRRLLLHCLQQLGAPQPPGPELSRAVDALVQGRTVTLSGMKLSGGECWRIEPAPPRR